MRRRTYARTRSALSSALALSLGQCPFAVAISMFHRLFKHVTESEMLCSYLRMITDQSRNAEVAAVGMLMKERLLAYCGGKLIVPV